MVHKYKSDRRTTYKEYVVKTLVPNMAYSVQFNLGFRIDQRINIFLYKVIQDLAKSGEIKYTPKKYMLNQNNEFVFGDFKFVLLEEVLSNESELSKWDNFITSTKLLIKRLTVSPARWFGIDTSNVVIEKAPIIIEYFQRICKLGGERSVENVSYYTYRCYCFILSSTVFSVEPNRLNC